MSSPVQPLDLDRNNISAAVGRVEQKKSVSCWDEAGFRRNRVTVMTLGLRELATL